MQTVPIFGRSGEHLALLVLVLHQMQCQETTVVVLTVLEGFGGCGGFGRDGYPPLNSTLLFRSTPKERRRRRAEKRLSKRVFLESPFLLCPLKVCS